MAERYFAHSVKLGSVTAYTEYLKDTLLLVQTDLVYTPFGLGKNPHVMISYLNDVPTLTPTGGATVSYSAGTTAPTFITGNTSDFVTIADGDSSTGYVLTADVSAVDMITEGTFNVIYQVADAAGNTSDTLAVTFTITADVTVPVITLTATTLDIEASNVATWDGGVANMVSATDVVDGDVSGDVVYTYNENTSGGSVLADIAAAIVFLGTEANAVYVTYNVDDTAGNSAVEKTLTITAIADV